MIKPTNTGAVIEAMDRFDREVRETPQWTNWESQGAHKFAFVRGGRRYPMKEIIWMATGTPKDDFSGGSEAIRFAARHGISVEALRLPAEGAVKAALHDLLLEDYPAAVLPSRAYEELGTRFCLSKTLRSLLLPNSDEVHWENRIRQARRKLVDEQIVDNSQYGEWSLRSRPKKKYWIEKSFVSGRPDRMDGPHALGRSLWSPTRDRDDGDGYRLMRLVQPGDVVFHLTDNSSIVGASVVASRADPTLVGLPGTDWASRPCYNVELEQYEALRRPLHRDKFLGNPALRDRLLSIRSKHENLFYTKLLELHEGAYLTEAPGELINLLNDLYLEETGSSLPHLKGGHVGFFDPPADGPFPEKAGDAEPRSYWLVGAIWDKEDQTSRFVREGVWQNGYDDTYLGEVRAMRPGEKIAIKSSYTRKHNLPFDGGGMAHSVMAIKAIGTIVENLGDGKNIRVNWEPLLNPREWFFYTNRSTIWRLRRGDKERPYDDLLIAFVFEEAGQDHKWFLAEPYWREKMKDMRPEPRTTDAISQENDEVEEGSRVPPYTIEQIIEDGIFLGRPALQNLLTRLLNFQNVILEGPPGVGKTFLARRVAFALMGERDETRVTRVQFHQAMAYEDFVRGLRPRLDGRGGFELLDGVFVRAAEAARADPERRPHVLIIEEINRGNPSQIFGELLTLIEHDKRHRDYGVRLAHMREGESEFYIPKNLYVIGTMNLADRSLALVDYALRRRWSFVRLDPSFGVEFRAWSLAQGLTAEFVDDVIKRVSEVNALIAEDRALGPDFQIGHSYLCCSKAHLEQQSQSDWYRAAVETQILPLLKEYWLDSKDKVSQARTLLLDA